MNTMNDQNQPEPSEALHPLHPDLRQGRIIQLDVLRGVAILMVLWFHAVIPAQRAGFFYPIANFGVRIGWSGVDLFFVLSGFLIGGLLFKELRLFGKLNIRRFWIRRGLKIWPAYYAMLLVVFLEIGHQQGMRAAAVAITPNLLHLQNYLRPIRGPTWSLAVEEHFYLILPLVLVIFVRRSPQGRATLSLMPWIMVFVGIAGLALRIILGWHGPILHTDRTHLNIDGMFFGVFLAYLQQFHFKRFLRLVRWRYLPLLTAALLAPLYCAIPLPLILANSVHTMIYLGYGFLIIILVHQELGNGFLGRLLNTKLSKVLAFIGFYSYSIYLWFTEVENWMGYRLEHHAPHWPAGLVWILAMAVYILVVIAVAVLMAELIEIPMLALRNRWFPPRASLTTPPTAPAPAET